MRASTMLKGAAAMGLWLAAGTAGAGYLATERGYDSCIDNLEGAYPRRARLVHARYYYYSASSVDMTYYVNSTAWEDGDRVRLRTRCMTDRLGRDLLARETEHGRWVRSRGKVTVKEVGGR